jgi:hypothetical protein
MLFGYAVAILCRVPKMRWRVSTQCHVPWSWTSLELMTRTDVDLDRKACPQTRKTNRPCGGRARMSRPGHHLDAKPTWRVLVWPLRIGMQTSSSDDYDPQVMVPSLQTKEQSTTEQRTRIWADDEIPVVQSVLGCAKSNPAKMARLYPWPSVEQ